MTFGVATVDDGDLAVISGDRLTPLAALLPGRAAEPGLTLVDLLAGWDDWCDAVEDALARSGSAAADRGTHATYRPPLVPPTVYCAGANYVDHIEEMTGRRPPRGEGTPYHFVVPGGALSGHGATVRIPDGCTQLDWEIELAVVVGHRAERVSTTDALDHVAGYSVANDLSMRDFALRPDTPFGVDWLRSKAHAACLPLGPVVVPARFVPDPQDLALRLWVGDELMQDSNTSEMLFGVAEQLASLSEIVPLLPGDVISTGTPAGVGFARERFLRPGDVVTAEIERVGRLVTRIA